MVDESTDHTNVTSDTYTAGTANCETTFTAPTSGKVWVTCGGNAGGTGVNRIYISFEIRLSSVAGAVHTAASDTNAAFFDCATSAAATVETLVTGLTAGSTYYIRAMHRTLTTGTTGDVYDRRIGVKPAP
jgi:hypothetical protein